MQVLAYHIYREQVRCRSPFCPCTCCTWDCDYDKPAWAFDPAGMNFLRTVRPYISFGSSNIKNVSRHKCCNFYRTAFPSKLEKVGERSNSRNSHARQYVGCFHESISVSLRSNFVGSPQIGWWYQYKFARLESPGSRPPIAIGVNQTV